MRKVRGFLKYSFLAAFLIPDESHVSEIKTLKKLMNSMFFYIRSEANDLAVQLARTYTKHYDVAVIDE